MDDDDGLDAIRQRRLAEMQAQYAGGAQAAAEREAQQRAAEEQRHMIISQLLTADARERLSRVRLVKPENARAVEDVIIRNAQSGNIRGKVDEEMLRDILERVGTVSKKKTTIQYKRRGLDDDED